MKTLLTLFLGLVFCTVLSAQGDFSPTFRNQITLTLGVNHGYLKDRNFSPYNHSSGGLRVGLGYQRSTKSGNLWNAEIGLGLLNLGANGEKWPRADRYLIDLAVGYRKGLSGNTEERQIYVGGNYRSYVDLTLFDDTEAITFFALHGLEAAVATNWKTGPKHQLKAEVALPVFGLLVRPPYTGWDKFIADNSSNIPKILTRGDWTSLNNFFGLRGSMGWAYQVRDNWTIEANYGVAYYATKRLDPVRSLNNQFSLKTTLNY